MPMGGEKIGVCPNGPPRFLFGEVSGVNVGKIFGNPVGSEGFQFWNGAGTSSHGENLGPDGAGTLDVTLSIADH